MFNNNRNQDVRQGGSPQMSKMASFGESRQSSTGSESSRYGNPMPSKVMNPVYELQSKRQRRMSSDEGSVTSLGSNTSKTGNTLYEGIAVTTNPIYEQTPGTTPKTTNPIYEQPGSLTKSTSSIYEPTNTVPKAVSPIYTELQPRKLSTDSTDLSTSPTSINSTGASSITKMPRPRSAGSEDNRPPITAPKPKLAAKPTTRPNSVWNKTEKRYSTSSALSIDSTKSENRMSIDSVKSDNRMSTGSSVSENRMSSGSDSSQNYPLGSSVTPVSVVNPALSNIPVMEGNAKVINLAQLKVNGQSRSSDSLESTDSGSSANKLTVTEPAPIPTPRQKVRETFSTLKKFTK